MEPCSSSLCFSFSANPQLLSRVITTLNANCRSKKIKPHVLRVSAHSYQKFIHFALNETKLYTVLVPSSLQKTFSSMTAMDGRTELKMQSFEAPKIRLLRSLSIENEEMQNFISGHWKFKGYPYLVFRVIEDVLDFTIFARPEIDVPIFCANFFTAANMNIIVLDLNPLHNVIDRRDYKEKYYKSLLPVGLKYAELFPWGGKLTSESLQFFSPIVIWTKFASSQSRYDDLFSAFVDYYKAWLLLIKQAKEETDASQIICNREAQHKYLTWRAEKDPGHGVLRRLIGERLAKDVVRNFLFNGLDELGGKGFLDYFPEYRNEDGSVNQKRSIIGKSFDNRPWNAKGEFIGNNTNM